MERWEYAVVRVDNMENTYSVNGGMPSTVMFDKPPFPFEVVLNNLGTEGWEMVTANLARGGPGVSVFIFKRAVGPV
jgi:hypothetical protein